MAADTRLWLPDVRAKLERLGYAVTCAREQDWRRDPPRGETEYVVRADDQAQLLLCPTPELSDLPDAADRGVVALHIVADWVTKRAVLNVLASYRLDGGPTLLPPEGGHPIILCRYDGPPLFRPTAAIGADPQLVIEHARRDAVEPSATLPLNGSWANVSLLSTPRKALPELHADDVVPLLRDIERAAREAREAAMAHATDQPVRAFPDRWHPTTYAPPLREVTERVTSDRDPDAKPLRDADAARDAKIADLERALAELKAGRA